MKPYEKIILSYIHKYKTINLIALSYELNVNSSILSDIIRDLYNKQYFIYHDGAYTLTEKSIDEITPLWNEWSFSFKQTEVFKQEITWDYLYIPQNFDKIYQG